MKRKREIARQIAKKLVKMKLRSDNRRRDFRGILDLGVGVLDKGSKEWAQPPRRVLKAIAVDGKKQECSLYLLCLSLSLRLRLGVLLGQ